MHCFFYCTTYALSFKVGVQRLVPYQQQTFEQNATDCQKASCVSYRLFDTHLDFHSCSRAFTAAIVGGMNHTAFKAFPGGPFRALATRCEDKRTQIIYFVLQLLVVYICVLVSVLFIRQLYGSHTPATAACALSPRYKQTRAQKVAHLNMSHVCLQLAIGDCCGCQRRVVLVPQSICKKERQEKGELKGCEDLAYASRKHNDSYSRLWVAHSI